VSKKVYNDDDTVILLYRIESRIVKEKNKLGILKPKMQSLRDQGVEAYLFALEMEPVINGILKDSGAKQDVLQ